MRPQVQKLYLATGNDRLKLLVLYSGEDDERLRKAAAGTLAMLTAEQPELCARIPGTVSRPLQRITVSHTCITPALQRFTSLFKQTSLPLLFSDNPLAGDHTVAIALRHTRPVPPWSGHSSQHDAGGEEPGRDYHGE